VSSARFRFHGDLAMFLPRHLRAGAFEHAAARAATLKNAIEALGVPHTEVGALAVNGSPATLQRILREGDDVDVYPPKSGSDPDLRFVADAHLGGLARFLRMLGFDTLFGQRFADAEIRRLACDDGRIVLTRDRELLKCADVTRGCYVRALKPEAQLVEVAARYRLADAARPFTLCLHCNLPLEALGKAEVAGRVPEPVFLVQQDFMRCRGCERVYWPGSHYERMRAALRRALA
jgi:uncharacterized protein with PIN domain